MEISFCQLYIQPGVNFPFTHDFQHQISQLVTERVTPSAAFQKRFGEVNEIGIYLSAKAEIEDLEFRGPGAYRKDKEVEYSLFLPFSRYHSPAADNYRRVLRDMVCGTAMILEKLQLDPSRIKKDVEMLVEELATNPRLVKD